eukprot:CAMPEP_0198569040 /NCGR_PEP_ID=MMETSP1462-20131121/107271_1 /TAXON_ID=1333877 /ORGANISM="Brandtodinium nutriculum, Strain RCC3387" /LENGTH=52 /DNA_ID=CAMNT_0044300123 /DNA_START=8 /DNA_END=162 /DNA_ORIENTATION=+
MTSLSARRKWSMSQTACQSCFTAAKTMGLYPLSVGSACFKFRPLRFTKAITT